MLLKTSGMFFLSQSILGADQIVLMDGMPVMWYVASRPNSRSRISTSSVDRLSSQKMALWSGWPFLSRTINVSPWLEMAIAFTSVGTTFEALQLSQHRPVLARGTGFQSCWVMSCLCWFVLLLVQVLASDDYANDCTDVGVGLLLPERTLRSLIVIPRLK